MLKRSRFLLDGIKDYVDVTVDDVSWKVLPQACDSLVMNPSFDDGADFWHVSERSTPHRVNIELVEGATGENDKAIKIYNRNHAWRGMRQRLDNSCFVPGEEYVITAMFKLTHSESGEGATICATRPLNGGQTTTLTLTLQPPTVRMPCFMVTTAMIPVEISSMMYT